MEKIKKIAELIYELVKTKFYGELLIKFEAGNIKLVRKTENIVM